MRLHPTNGVNLRLPGSETPESQWLLMQNYDMKDKDYFEQIKGSVKYHNAILGTNAPTAIMVNYNEQTGKNDVVAAVDTKLVKKNFGANEFEDLLLGLSNGKITGGVSIDNNLYIVSPEDGYFEYDGISKVRKLITNTTTGESIKLRDIVYSKETNRCFGITKDNELVWTDDLATTGGVPILWPAVNVTTFPPESGDVPEKLWILDGRLIVLKTNSLWVYYIIGSPSNWRPYRISFSGGCIAPKTVKEVGSELWFLGWSPNDGRGVYAFDGRTVRLISYDVQPFIDRINPNRIQNACAEYVDKIYKLSLAIDSSLENDHTLHFDTLNINKDSGAPAIYGPHTYGFNASAILDTRRFQGEHIFARKHTDGARIFRVSDYETQYSDELVDNGSLIPTVLISGIVSRHETKEGFLDETWMKRYSKLYIDYPQTGAFPAKVDVLKGFKENASSTYQNYMEGSGVVFGSDVFDSERLSYSDHPMDFVSDAIQFKITNENVNKKTVFRSISFDVALDRRKKNVQIVSLN